MNESTYLAIKQVLQTWYGLTNDRANLQVLGEIALLIDKEIDERIEAEREGNRP
ncbi:MAG: hypothetical protein Q7O66_16575 [Dehalococcoidia bacterium]|nr:hypothetical protein [Dehalococcoidia bacterium]